MGNDARLLQFTAPIQPGNSGGPIVDTAGHIIGVIQSKLSEIPALKESGSLPQNINFGIKADLAANFVRASGAPSTNVEMGAPRKATTIAQDGRGFTFQIRCMVDERWERNTGQPSGARPCRARPGPGRLATAGPAARCRRRSRPRPTAAHPLHLQTKSLSPVRQA